MIDQLARARAQIAYEYLILIFFFTALFTVFLLITAAGQEDLQWEADERSLEDFALGLQDELYLSAMQPEGFTKTITLPGTINAKPYNLTFHAPSEGDHYFTIKMNGHFADKQAPKLQLPENHEETTITAATITLQQAARLQIT